jgi:predicted enzyme related to lactoylglutathione lyase
MKQGLFDERKLPMSEVPAPAVGTIGWIDLTVEHADALRDFYAAVTGWTPTGITMGDYDDYAMCAPDGNAVAGICHARGSNADIPPQWMMYIIVADVHESVRQCEARGGSIIGAVRDQAGQAQYAVIRDPAGAVCALYQPA